MNKIKVLLVDDHLMFLEGLQSLFANENNIEVVGTASNVGMALTILKDKQTDIIITDLSMPDVDGSSLIDTVKSKYPYIHTLVLSMHNEANVISKIVKQEVNGYLLKNAEKEELLTAVSTIVNGENYFSKEVKDIISESTFSRKYNPMPELSKREKEVLHLIGDEYTTKEIADKLFISQNTVETHRKNMFSKLSVKNVAGLIRIAIKNNLLES
ncbi:response regulator [Flammeovirga kamogawensis]|uniref:Response regulator transcription factor n=1 Tax=Flammeovirga kamogawensis TaxID=373891 RepID=A0ABX8GWM5_9BACT|nr:response regulator transcription factor [Flammeovirga kamogawensis]MBB6461545.1 DNA-binding NarL/FixJ family response regulator [Flammeovirga kamogawensis]QWG07522.1 response regulator transcription factor [Flammeovirga kamogawensis]TRX69336.1 response regulator transcription factor [Flammeovirga kamogawensis]